MEQFLRARARDPRYTVFDRSVYSNPHSVRSFHGETVTHTFSAKESPKKKKLFQKDADGDGKTGEGKEKPSKKEWDGDSDGDGVPDAIDSSTKKKKKKEEEKDEKK